MGIRPDLTIEISKRLMNENDGPTLEHGLQAFQGRGIHLPRRQDQHPSREHLELRYANWPGNAALLTSVSGDPRDSLLSCSSGRELAERGWSSGARGGGNMFKETHPILGTRDIQRAIEFYTQRLGFALAFGDKAEPPNYVGFRRDGVELHMQFQFEHEMGTIRLRFLVRDPDALFDEYRQRGVECTTDGARNTPWGTREFALYDLDRNSLTFYRHLRNNE